jgi:spore germination protein YaaH
VESGVTVWLPYWEMPAALSSTVGNAGVIGTASPYWFAISGQATVHDEPGAGDASTVSQLLARGLQVVPMVTEDAGLAQFGRILASGRRRAAMVHALVSIVAHDGYSGLDLDFENFAYDPHHRSGVADRAAALYPVLVGQACAALHAIGRTCEVTVMPRTTAAHLYWHGDIATWVYDYGALAKVADRIQIMAYDDHSPGGPAGPIAPLPWVRQVIAFTRSQSAPARDELGVPAYGYDWYGSTSATAVYASQAAVLATRMHARIRWSAAEGEDTFTYRQDHHAHTVWFENATADYERAALAKAAGFAGIAIWAAGYEQPALWPLLSRLRFHGTKSRGTLKSGGRRGR